jgi:hypothetical protein
MTNYDRIVDDIRTVLTADVDPSEDALRELDERFASAVSETNERLRECDALLNKGHRGEAIQKCEAEPNLLDVVSTLDFPEFELWVDYVKQFGYPGTPALLTDVAEQLNEAYNENASLSDLLRQHRLHALLRSRLPTRMKILRTLAERDFGNPIWQDDIRSYEKVRHNQLQEETEAAVAANDLKRLSQLEQEVRSEAWLEQPPKEIARRTIEAHTNLRVKHSRDRLEKLGHDMNAAHSDLDVPRGREAREAWNALAAIGIERDDDPLLDLVAPAFDWLEEEDRREQEASDYEKTLVQMNQALDDWAPREDLERLAYKLRSFDREVDPTLNERLRERLETIEIAARRRGRLIALGSILAVVLIGSLIVWGVYAYSKSTVLARHVATLKGHIDKNELKLGLKYDEKLEKDLPEDVYSKDPIFSLRQQLYGLKNNYEALLTRIETRLDEAGELGKIGRIQAKTICDEIEKLAAELSAKYGAEDDKNRVLKEVAQLRSEVDGIRRDAQRERDNKFVERLKSYNQSCKDVDATDVTSLDQLIAKGEELKKTTQVSMELINRVTPLIKRLNSQKEATLKSRREAEMLSAIHASVGGIGEFRRTLQEYSRSFPETPAAVSFQQTVEREGKLWEGVAAWNDLIGTWSGRDFTAASPQQAEEYITQAQSLIEAHPGFDSASNIQELVAFLTAITGRVNEQGQRIFLDLNRQLSKEAIANLRMALVKEEGVYKRYYLGKGKTFEPRSGLSGRMLIRCYADLGLSDLREAQFFPQALADSRPPGQRQQQNGRDWESPQARFSRFALDQLTGLNDQNWESRFSKIIGELDKELFMEPILRAQLLRLVLQIGCAGSHPLKVGYKTQFESLESTRLNDTANWIAPDDNEANKARSQAELLLARIGLKTIQDPISTGVEEATSRVVSLWKQLKPRSRGARHVWVGWLYRDEREWKVGMKHDSDSPSGDLLIVAPGSDNRPEWLTVGTVQGGEVDLRSQPTRAFQEGRPVYTRVNDPPN